MAHLNSIEPCKLGFQILGGSLDHLQLTVINEVFIIPLKPLSLGFGLAGLVCLLLFV